MRITSINKNNNYKTNNFKANARWVLDSKGKQLYRTTTYYFRDDLDFKSLVHTLCSHFRSAKHVNFINHACSNGMEPYSFIMSFLTFCPHEIKKFIPILAKDINTENINAAKTGSCGASENDFRRIYYYLKDKWHDYLSIYPAKNKDNLFIMKPNKIITDKIMFEQGDIINDVDQMPPENTFLSCRNVWGYLPINKQEELAEKLGKRFKKGSAVLIGYLDTKEGQTTDLKGYADILLEKNGFKRCFYQSEFQNIFFAKT